jgi:hypothetical protein
MAPTQECRLRGAPREGLIPAALPDVQRCSTGACAGTCAQQWGCHAAWVALDEMGAR